MLVLFMIGLLAYLIASLGILLTLLAPKPVFKKIAHISSFTAFILVTCLFVKMLIPLFTEGFENFMPIRDFYLISFIWFFSLFLLGIWKKLNNPMLFSIASPLFFLLLHTAMLTPQENVSVQFFVSFFFILHVGALFFALIALFTAGIAGIFFLIEEKAMKRKKLTKYKFLPSLEALDSLNYFATVTGFPAYTIGLFSGFIWAYSAWGRVFSADIKEIISLFVWLLYCALFHMRIGLGLKGKKPAMLLLLLCFVSLFSLLGVNLLFDTHHQF